uniref:zinc finger protein ZFPM1-like n=1 Tax=Arvicanthis niloticus TaxID=61156 RepID=UPI00148712FB|nr:zinc finger protein ZFPM1-like [Arvicanthis niloticus]
MWGRVARSLPTPVQVWHDVGTPEPDGCDTRSLGRLVPGGPSPSKALEPPGPQGPRVFASSPASLAPHRRHPRGLTRQDPSPRRGTVAAESPEKRAMENRGRPDGPRRQRHGSSWHRKRKHGGRPRRPLFPPAPPSCTAPPAGWPRNCRQGRVAPGAWAVSSGWSAGMFPCFLSSGPKGNAPAW